MAINSLCSPLSSAWSSARSSSSSACSVSACEWTDTYSPAAIDIAPATRPATPATNTLLWVACAAATPSTKLDVDRIPSLAPSTAARSQAMRPVRCSSLLLTCILDLICDLRGCYLASMNHMTNSTGSVLVVGNGVRALLPTGAQDEPR